MTSRDPERGDAPQGEPATGRFPGAPLSFEQSAERFAALPGDHLSADPPPARDAPAAESAPPAGPAPAIEPAPPAAPAARRGSFRRWRGGRPFVGGLLMTLGGLEILASEKASLGVVVHIGMQGLTGYLIPAMLVVCGVLTIFNPAQRMFYSVLGVLLSLGSWVTSNLGGFFVGLLLGGLGSCLAFGWLPDQGPRGRLLRRSRTALPVPEQGAGAGHPGGGAAAS